MTIEKRLKEERERLGLSQTSLGALVGVVKQTVIQWEKGASAPDAGQLAAIAAAGADVLYILTNMRNENTATNPTELAYLRNCRALPTQVAKDAGLKMLVSLREAYGIKW